MSSVILIVDDDPISRESLQEVLANQDYMFETAASGAEAIRKARIHPPDLILLDVMMPEMDGFEVCRKIRALPEIAEVPILVLTALDDRESLINGLNSGADDFLTKPINRYELRARVRSITRLNRYRRLQEERARIAELAHQMIDLQEEERRRISRELHDDVGQSITTLGIGLGLLMDELPLTATHARTRVTEMISVTNQTIEQLRLLSRELHPPSLEMVGLGPTLEGYCRDFSRRTELPVLFSMDTSFARLPDAINITLYRFLQEALTNIIKHAEASQIWVKLGYEPDGVRLTVRDDGSGFPEAMKGVIDLSMHPGQGSAGMGLLGMVERMEQLGGHVELDSQPGQGCKLTAWLPLKE